MIKLCLLAFFAFYIYALQLEFVPSSLITDASKETVSSIMNSADLQKENLLVLLKLLRIDYFNFAKVYRGPSLDGVQQLKASGYQHLLWDILPVSRLNEDFALRTYILNNLEDTGRYIKFPQSIWHPEEYSGEECEKILNHILTYQLTKIDSFKWCRFLNTDADFEPKKFFDHDLWKLYSIDCLRMLFNHDQKLQSIYFDRVKSFTDLPSKAASLMRLVLTMRILRDYTNINTDDLVCGIKSLPDDWDNINLISFKEALLNINTPPREKHIEAFQTIGLTLPKLLSKWPEELRAHFEFDLAIFGLRNMDFMCSYPHIMRLLHMYTPESVSPYFKECMINGIIFDFYLDKKPSFWPTEFKFGEIIYRQRYDYEIMLRNWITSVTIFTSLKNSTPTPIEDFASMTLMLDALSRQSGSIELYRKFTCNTGTFLQTLDLSEVAKLYIKLVHTQIAFVRRQRETQFYRFYCLNTMGIFIRASIFSLLLLNLSAKQKDLQLSHVLLNEWRFGKGSMSNIITKICYRGKTQKFLDRLFEEGRDILNNFRYWTFHPWVKYTEASYQLDQLPQ